MNKKRLGSLSMRHWGLLLAMAVLTIAYANFADSPSLMAAVTTRELPVYNVDTEEKVLSVSFDAGMGTREYRGNPRYSGSIRGQSQFLSRRFLGRKVSRTGRRIAGQGTRGGQSFLQPIRICQSSPTRRFARS